MIFFRAISALTHKGIRIHSSQNGEDVLIRPYLRKFKKAYYLDLGAYDPFKLSNTLVLYTEGWNGVNIDANKKTIKQFQKYRPSDTSIHSAVVSKKESVDKKEGIDFYIDKDKDVSQCATGSLLVQKNQLLSRVRVPVITIPEVLDICDLKKTQYLNIDLEGYDEVILKEFDFENFRPAVVSVEDHHHSIFQVIESSITKYMVDNQYDLVARGSMTSIFVDSSIL